jgi:hypothetical protein
MMAMGNNFRVFNISIRCSSDCTIETGYECDNSEPSDCYEICGDGLVYGNLECDDGDNIDGDG